MKAKQFLKQYEYAEKRARHCREQYEKTLEKIDSIRSTLGGDGMPHGSGINRQTENLAIELNDAANRYVKAEREALQKKTVVENVINSLQPSDRGVVLYERYINLMQWESIAALMCYSMSNVFKLHYQALQEVEVVINESYRDLL